MRRKVGSPKTKNAIRWVNVKPYVMEMLKQHLKGRTGGFSVPLKAWYASRELRSLNKRIHPRSFGDSDWNVAACTASGITV